MPVKKHSFTLKAAERLKHRKKIDVLFAGGQKFSLGEIRVVFTTQKEDSGKGILLIGVGVSKRYFKKAVDRNTLKRLLRESARLEKGSLLELVQSTACSVDLFILYTGKEMTEFAHCKQLVHTAFQKLIKKIAVHYQ